MISLIHGKDGERQTSGISKNATTTGIVECQVHFLSGQISERCKQQSYYNLSMSFMIVINKKKGYSVNFFSE